MSDLNRSFEQATWIAPLGAKNLKNYYFRARKAFFVEKICDKVELIIAAESTYILYLNGDEIGRGPARGTHAINYYDCYSVASKLKIGRNEVGVLCYCGNIETFIAAPAEPAVIVEIVGLLKTDFTWQVADADEEWRREVNLYTVQTGFSEWRDLRKEPLGWNVFQDSASWENAVRVHKSSRVWEKQLLPRSIPQLDETVYRLARISVAAIVPMANDLENIEVARLMTSEEHHVSDTLLSNDSSLFEARGQAVTTVKPMPDGKGVAITFDFDREIIGRFEMEVSASAGTIIDIGYEEQLTGKRLRVAHADAMGERYDFADRYILRDGRQGVGSSLMERGFRMAQIVLRNFYSPVLIHHVRAIDRRYPLTPVAFFRCSDPVLNKIWDACVETLSACTTDIFTDCPWRERSFWVNDLLVENLIFLQLTGDRRLPARALQMTFSETARNGLVNGVCPCPIGGKKDDWLALPATNLFLTLILRDYYLYTGDVHLVRDFFPKIQKILEEFDKFTDERGFVTFPPEYWNFFDWSYEANNHSLNGKTSAPLNFLYLIALKAYKELLAATETDPASPEFDPKISRLSASLHDAFLNRATGRLSDYIEAGRPAPLSSQLSHALAMLAEESSLLDRSWLLEGLNDPNLLVPELYMHYFIFAAQKKSGSTKDGLGRIRKYWGNIVSTGSPTIWEFGVHTLGKAAIDGKGSLCHGFSTSPIDFFQTTILGVYPKRPGFTEFWVVPQAFDLDQAGGRIPTPSGFIEIAWKRTFSALSVSLVVPSGCQAVTADGRRFEFGSHDFEIDQKFHC